MMAAIALLQFTVGKLALFIVTTVRAAKPLRPSPSVKRIKTLIFSTVLTDELVQTNSFLELHLLRAMTNSLKNQLHILLLYTVYQCLAIVVIR